MIGQQHFLYIMKHYYKRPDQSGEYYRADKHYSYRAQFFYFFYATFGIDKFYNLSFSCDYL